MKSTCFKILVVLFFMMVFIPQNVYGMHISEGFLAPKWCLLWYGITFPFLIFGLSQIKKLSAINPKIKILLGVAGAFTFLLSALKLPSVTGSCSHMTGTGLGGILFGPATMSILGFIVLLFQSLLLAHGGLTTLGANTFTMGIAGPMLSWCIYRTFLHLRINGSVSVFVATFTGSLFTYCCTAFQLALAFPSSNGSITVSFIKFISIFGITQLPLAIIEGLISTVVFTFIQSQHPHELIALNIYKSSYK